MSEAHGFRKQRSIVSNARPHLHSDVVVNLDLQDFFPTVSYKRIKGLFRCLGCSESAATVFGLICTEPETVPVELEGVTYHVALGQRFLPRGGAVEPRADQPHLSAPGPAPGRGGAETPVLLHPLRRRPELLGVRPRGPARGPAAAASALGGGQGGLHRARQQDPRAAQGSPSGGHRRGGQRPEAEHRARHPAPLPRGAVPDRKGRARGEALGQRRGGGRGLLHPRLRQLHRHGGPGQGQPEPEPVPAPEEKKDDGKKKKRWKIF